MEHKTLADLQAVADIQVVDRSAGMSRDERRRRWIELLEANPNTQYRSLHEIELLSPSQRRDCRADNSPLSLAFADPVLRSAGLQSERVGHCTDFFELSDEQMHHAFCSCHVGLSLSGMQAAHRLRRLFRTDDFRRGLKRLIPQGFRLLFSRTERRFL